MDVDVGTARVVYETPDGVERVEVDNEHVAFVDEHWVVVEPSGEADEGTVTRIPRDRVYRVERSTEEVTSRARDLLDEATSKLG
ncbi:hypothetical protein [Halomarina oriensis]|uniref:Uncharacterized protein n=1 Tax=Halomarina oriensis TaxID=671145 RepID=A0A6B0GID4_9EURY|nr:hypothetical protein [Halomarina oriensis]MWG34504.1 hypothetical protein [Halomarina oriensis]